MSIVRLQMFLSKPSIGKIANGIANKSAKDAAPKASNQPKFKLFSKHISIIDLFSKRIESKNIEFWKFIVDEYSGRAL